MNSHAAPSASFWRGNQVDGSPRLFKLGLKTFICSAQMSRKFAGGSYSVPSSCDPPALLPNTCVILVPCRSTADPMPFRGERQYIHISPRVREQARTRRCVCIRDELVCHRCPAFRQGKFPDICVKQRGFSDLFVSKTELFVAAALGVRNWLPDMCAEQLKVLAD